jgi:hypothetical protein
MFVERILEAFDTLETQRPGVLLADGRVEREQNVLQGHAAAGVQAEGRLVCAAGGHRHVGRHLVRSKANRPPGHFSHWLSNNYVADHMGMDGTELQTIIVSTVRSAERKRGERAIERASSEHCASPTD